MCASWSMISEHGRKKDAESLIKKELSSGVIMISKPSGLARPALADGFGADEQCRGTHRDVVDQAVDPTTTTSTAVECWDAGVAV